MDVPVPLRTQYIRQRESEVAEQAVANTVEYNKIHALARARKLVVSKFGNALMNFWPMSDEGTFIRDLLRQHPLVGKGSPVMKLPGMIDYGVQLPSGAYISDISPDKEFGGTTTGGATDYNLKPVAGKDLAVGLWRGLHIHNFQATQTGTVTLKVWIAPANTSPSNLDSQAIAYKETTASVVNGEFYGFDVVFDNPVLVLDTGYWMYFDWSGVTGTLRWMNCNAPYDTVYWTGSAYQTVSGMRIIWLTALGFNDSLVYPALARFCAGAWVNVDDKDAKNGAVITLSSTSEKKAQIFVTSEKKAQGYIKTASGTVTTLTAPTRLHPGYNFISLSYDKNVADEGIKLGVNGKVVAKATSPNEDLFNTTMSISISGTSTLALPNAVVDDVFLAKDVPTDEELWDIYLAYITSAPLMQVESVTVA